MPQPSAPNTGGGQCVTSLAIAQRELNAYFASPIAYVLIGFFALLFGWFFYVPLAFFEQQSMQMGMNPTQALNINQMLVGPTLMNTTVIMLFLFPLITMRTYSEEKRSGTIELLLTSPITDVEIILGKFLGAMLLYAAMLAVTMIHMAILFIFGDPEWKPIATGYLGPAADGRLLPVARPVHLEPDEEPDRRRDGDLRGVPDAVGDQLDRHLRRPDHAGGAAATCRSPSTSTTSRRASSTPST